MRIYDIIQEHYRITIGHPLTWGIIKKENFLYVFWWENAFKLSKVQSCKLYNKNYMVASTQITSAENFAFIAVLVFMLLSRKVLFINRKDNK